MSARRGDARGKRRGIPRTPRRVLTIAAGLVSFACATGGGTPPPAGGPPPGQRIDTVADETIGDTSGLVPAGYGTLRQEDVAIRLTLRGVQVRAIPLDEGIIRVLSPDSYRALRDLLESRRAEITRIAGRYGVRRPSVWYVSYFGVEPEARFSPMEVIVTSAGRNFRPLEIIPLSPGFGENRLRQRETQTALYIFEEEVDPEQPLDLAVQGERSSAWSGLLQRIQRERALIRARVQRPPSSASRAAASPSSRAAGEGSFSTVTDSSHYSG